MIPDDGSLQWFLHSIMGLRVTPGIANEIMARAKKPNLAYEQKKR